ncbi:helix-turn-helix transcriptional regulator [Paenibacillus sp. FSL W7-1287]
MAFSLLALYQVAVKALFLKPRYFSKLFKQVVGLSPNEYRSH